MSLDVELHEGLDPRGTEDKVNRLSEEVKYLKGLWIVSLYGAFEKSLNSIFNEVLGVVEASEATFNSLKPSLKTIFGYSHIQSIKDCSYDTVIEKAIDFFRTSESPSKVALSVNPLTTYLQNVDGKSIIFLCNVLSINDYQIDLGRLGRLNNLKERRNAVAHGRETPAEVGSRFSRGLTELHALVLEETSRFHLTCDKYCTRTMFNHR